MKPTKLLHNLGQSLWLDNITRDLLNTGTLKRYVGTKGRVIAMHSFGASAPFRELQRKFGFEPDQVVAVAKELLQTHEFETEDLRGQDVRDDRRSPVEKCSSKTAESLSYETANHS